MRHSEFVRNSAPVPESDLVEMFNFIAVKLTEPNLDTPYCFHAHLAKMDSLSRRVFLQVLQKCCEKSSHHDLRFTHEFIREGGLLFHEDEIVAWLGSHGGLCDCKTLLYVGVWFWPEGYDSEVQDEVSADFRRAKITFREEKPAQTTKEMTIKTDQAVDVGILIGLVVNMLDIKPLMTDRELHSRILADDYIGYIEDADNLVVPSIGAGRARHAALEAQKVAAEAEMQAQCAALAAKLHAAWAQGEIAAGRGDNLMFERFVNEGGLERDEEKHSPQPVGEV